MHWFKINNRRIICLETGHELSLSREERKYWGIHSTAYQAYIHRFKNIQDENEAQEVFNQFIAILKPIEINEEEQKETKEDNQQKQEENNIYT